MCSSCPTIRTIALGVGGTQLLDPNLTDPPRRDGSDYLQQRIRIRQTTTREILLTANRRIPRCQYYPSLGSSRGIRQFQPEPNPVLPVIVYRLSLASLRRVPRRKWDPTVIGSGPESHGSAWPSNWIRDYLYCRILPSPSQY